MVSKMQMHFKSSGHSVAVDRASSYYSVHGLFKETTTGIAFYKFLEDLSENFTEKADTVITKLKELMQLVFTKDKLLISITADEEGFRSFNEKLPSFTGLLKDHEDAGLTAAYDKTGLIPQTLNEGFKAAMQVQYVARAGNFLKAGYKYTGTLKVLKTILSYDYLWNNVRVKGGAYGCMCGFSGVDGDAYFTSYRDPNLKETNRIYEGIPDYVRNFSADEKELTKYIIGTFSTLDAPLTPQTNGKRSLSMYLAGITEEDLQKERDEILSVTADDIRSLRDIVKSVIDAGYICVIGNETKVMENKDLFKEIKTLIK
jgi:Zn-dependent M16 (insulinase) family peptidase